MGYDVALDSHLAAVVWGDSIAFLPVASGEWRRTEADGPYLHTQESGGGASRAEHTGADRYASCVAGPLRYHCPLVFHGSDWKRVSLAFDVVFVGA